MKHLGTALALVVSLAAVRPARADVQVSYLVDATAFKAAVAGTPLTFAVYNDATCTSQVGSVVVNVEKVTAIEALKLLVPKNTPKGTLPTKAVELVATLQGIAPPATAYLEVTGTGISPVGGACQLQLSSGAPSGLAGEGFVKGWARINADGTVASCYKCNAANTFGLGAGQYQVDFSPVASSIVGRPRTATLDTLGLGAVVGQIGVADRFQVPSAIFVQTTDTFGNVKNQPFTLVLY
jgi:hypothetical protein